LGDIDMRHLAIIVAVLISYTPIDSLGCEQKLIEEQGRVAIIYVPKGCEYGVWANMDVRVNTCDPKIDYQDKTHIEKIALKCNQEERKQDNSK
jgi:hypothetical protein